MKNKGFTLIELLVLIAIIGVLSSVILASVHNAKCKDDPTHKGCTVEKKINQIAEEESAIADKFDRSKKTVPVDTSIYDVEGNSFFRAEVTKDTACGDIPDNEAKSMCEDEFRRSKNLEECYNRYSNY